MAPDFASHAPAMLAAVGLYIALMLGIGFWAKRISHRQEQRPGSGPNSFIEEYFLAGRSLGGVTLAMAIVTTYTSASSFIGGPGMAYSLGLGWVLLAMIQVPTTFLTLGLIGRRLSAYSRKTGSVSISDFLLQRYGSKTLVTVTSICMILFFMAIMLAQFIGGARVFEAATGFPYDRALMLFCVTVALYTAIGGFRAVIMTDLVQGCIMVVAAVCILGGVIAAGGGIAPIMAKLAQIDPGLIQPGGAGGKITMPFLFSFWVLVGIGVLGLPQDVQKCMAYKDDAAMRRGMVVGTIVIGFILLCTHLSGALGRAVIPDLPAGDLVMPTLTVRLLPPFLAGLFLAGVLAAVMSTVSSMVIISSATILRDLSVCWGFKRYDAAMNPQSTRRISLGLTLVVGLVVFFVALHPPDLLVWINLFAFGGLEAVFFWPVMLGLYWKKANASGALCSITTGLACFISLTPIPETILSRLPLWLGQCLQALPNPFAWIPLGGAHPIIPSLVLAGIAFWAGNGIAFRMKRVGEAQPVAPALPGRQAKNPDQGPRPE